MRAVRAHRRTTRWTAALALMLAALAPALNHAPASATGTDRVEICTTLGSRWIASDVGGTERAPDSTHRLEHGPCCSLHTPAPGLPAVTAHAHPSLPLGHAMPRSFVAAPGTLHAWVRVQPRAPPRFS